MDASKGGYIEANDYILISTHFVRAPVNSLKFHRLLRQRKINAPAYVADAVHRRHNGSHTRA